MVRAVLRGCLAALPLAGCITIGPSSLDRDHLDYGQAIVDTEKRQTLLNAVRVRYGDVPSFLAVSSIISSYTLQGTGQLGLNAYATSASGNLATASGTAEYTEHPTFTFTPLTGEALAQSSIRPLSPSDLLPLAQNGLPIDVLFRLGVQSVGPLQNALPLGGSAQAGSPEFFELLAGMRTLQVTGGIIVRFQKQPDGNHVFLSLPPSPGAARVRALLGVSGGRGDIEVVYGRFTGKPNQVAVLTRSVTAMLLQVGSQVEAPQGDVEAGQTFAGLPNAGNERRPVIIVHSGPTVPGSTYVSARYRGSWFWVADDDFDSKLAFTIMELLIALAQSGAGGRAPILTLPAG